MKITKPGLYPDMPTADYFADPCPTPSFTQSIAKILLDQSPLHAWHAHPRLNPDWQPDDPTKFDVGNVAHKLMIGRGKEILVLDAFDDWRTKAAKEARETAQGEGKLAVLGEHFAKADAMVRAAREQLELRGLGDLFSDGDGEVVTAWREGAVWCRQMIDWLTPDHRIFVDYKTTDMSVAPQGLGRLMSNAGWHIQGAMGERGLTALEYANAGRRRYLFVVQETDVPYALNVVELSPDVMTIGRKMLDAALGIWRRCIETNRWPGYPAEIFTPEFPGWAESQWLAREITDASRDRVFENPMMAG